MQPHIATKELKALIQAELPILMRKDQKIREFVLEIAATRFADKKTTEDRFDKLIKRIDVKLEELRIEREANEKKWEANEKRWETNEKRWEEHKIEDNKKWEEWRIADNKKWEENKKTWEEHRNDDKKRWEEITKEWEINNKKWEENKKSREEQIIEDKKKWEENQRILIKEGERTDNLYLKYDVGLGAIGARWGMHSEESFRNGLKGILEDTFKVKVERYIDSDPEGLVHGKPDQVEIDLIIHNGVLILAEIKSSMSKPDMYSFHRKAEFYEKKHNIKVARKLVISPMMHPKAVAVARELNIEVYSFPAELNF